MIDHTNVRFIVTYDLILTDGIDDQLELLVLVFVVVLGVLVQYGDVNTSQNYLQVESWGSRQRLFNLNKICRRLVFRENLYYE